MIWLAEVRGTCWKLMLVASMTLCLAAGCGGKPKRIQIHVAGTIEYDGRAVPAGILYINPDLGKNNDGPQGFAIIKDGKYDTRLNPKNEGKPGTGPYLIVIWAGDGVAGPEAPMGQPLLKGEYVHPVELPEVDTEENIVIPAKAKR